MRSSRALRRNSLVAFAAVFAPFAVVPARGATVDDDPVGHPAAIMLGVMDGHRMTASERMMIEPPAMMVDNVQPAMVGKPVMVPVPSGDNDVAAAE